MFELNGRKYDKLSVHDINGRLDFEKEIKSYYAANGWSQKVYLITDYRNDCCVEFPVWSNGPINAVKKYLEEKGEIGKKIVPFLRKEYFALNLTCPLDIQVRGPYKDYCFAAGYNFVIQ